MLASIGVNAIDDLFDEIPQSLRIQELSDIPEGITEMALTRLMQTRSKKDEYVLNFIGAGAYEHHIPAAVWQIAARGEWLTAYTPYQAEASQGTLQLLYEYQTMMANLMAMDVSNASLYEGGSALAEAVLMAIRCHKKNQSRKILMPKSVHPLYRQVVKTIVQALDIEIIDLPYNRETGQTDINSLSAYQDEDIAALIIPQPNFFGVLEDSLSLSAWAKEKNTLVIGLVNPIAMALFIPPGEWSEGGADIVCGEGQPLGIPMASGGPYFGFLCCKKEHIRQLPGRLIGRTEDKAGNPGYTLTLQAREQHIRRSKATSNICTNQGLLVTAATIYMSLLGPEGLKRIAMQSHAMTRLLMQGIMKLKTDKHAKIEILFQSPFFHELVIRVPSVDEIINTLAAEGIQVGYDLRLHYPELGECLLICATETKTEEDIKIFVNAIERVAAVKEVLC